MKKLLTLILLCAASGLAQAQAQKGLDELLRQVQQGSQQDAKLNAEREQRFLRGKNEQADLVAKAEAELAAAKARSAGVRARFDAGQKTITDLKTQMQARAGDYTQVYAAVKSVAGDFRAVAASSLVGAQYPERLQFLDDLAQQKEMPDISQLEKFWYILQQEMTESGKVVRFKAKLLDEDGIERQAEVVRVGTFSAFDDDSYLTLQKGQLAVLTQQPAHQYRSLASDFSDTKTGYEPIMVDPSRGSLLLLEGERPGVMDRIEQGGFVGYIIIVVAIIAFVLAVYQMFYLYRVNGRVRTQLGNLQNPSDDNPLGRVLMSLSEARAPNPNTSATDAEVLELRLSEAVLRETPKLERFQSFIRLAVAAGPLLGLVGTVSGMIITFQVITELGAGDPKAMARGISQAMIATLLGLGEAIPLLFINAYLSSRSKAMVQILDEQSAGILSRALEKRM